jgi:hypothetical protein
MQRGHDWGSETSKPDIERHIHKEHIETISNDRTARPAGAIPSGKLPLEFGLEWVSREPTSAFGQRDIRAGQGLGMSTLNSGMPNQFRRVVDETPITANAAQFVPGYKGEVYGPVSENAQRQS